MFLRYSHRVIYPDKQNVLPVTVSKNKVRCLDFDMDKVVFKTASKSPIKMVEVNPCNKTLLEVMDMV